MGSWAPESGLQVGAHPPQGPGSRGPIASLCAQSLNPQLPPKPSFNKAPLGGKGRPLGTTKAGRWFPEAWGQGWGGSGGWGSVQRGGSEARLEFARSPRSPDVTSTAFQGLGGITKGRVESALQMMLCGFLKTRW